MTVKEGNSFINNLNWTHYYIILYFLYYNIIYTLNNLTVVRHQNLTYWCVKVCFSNFDKHFSDVSDSTLC